MPQLCQIKNSLTVKLVRRIHIDAGHGKKAWRVIDFQAAIMIPYFTPHESVSVDTLARNPQAIFIEIQQW